MRHQRAICTALSLLVFLAAGPLSGVRAASDEEQIRTEIKVRGDLLKQWIQELEVTLENSRREKERLLNEQAQLQADIKAAQDKVGELRAQRAAAQGAASAASGDAALAQERQKRQQAELALREKDEYIRHLRENLDAVARKNEELARRQEAEMVEIKGTSDSQRKLAEDLDQARRQASAMESDLAQERARRLELQKLADQRMEETGRLRVELEGLKALESDAKRRASEDAQSVDFLKGELAKAQQQLAQLEAERGRLAQQLSEARQQDATPATDLRRLEEQLAQARKERDDQQKFNNDKIGQLYNNISELQTKVIERTSERDAALRDLDAARRAAEAGKADTAGQGEVLKRLEDEARAARDAASAAQSQLKESKAQLAAATERAAAAEAGVRRLEGLAKEQTDVRANLEARLAEAGRAGLQPVDRERYEALVLELTAARKSVESDLAISRQELDEARKKAEGLVKLADDRAREIAELKQRVAAGSSQQEAQEKLMGQLEHLRREQDDMRNTVTAAQGEVQSLEAQLDARGEELGKLQKQLEEAEQAMKGSQLTAGTLSKDVETKTQQLKDAQKRIAELEKSGTPARVEAAEAKARAAEAKLAELEDRLQKRAEGLKEDQARVEEEKARMRLAEQKAQERIKGLEVAIADINDKVEDITASRDSAMNQVVALKDQLEAERRGHLAGEKAAQQAAADRDKLEAALQAARTEAAAARLSASEQGKGLEALKKSVASLEQQLRARDQQLVALRSDVERLEKQTGELRVNLAKEIEKQAVLDRAATERGADAAKAQAAQKAAEAQAQRLQKELEEVQLAMKGSHLAFARLAEDTERQARELKALAHMKADLERELQLVKGQGAAGKK